MLEKFNKEEDYLKFINDLINLKIDLNEVFLYKKNLLSIAVMKNHYNNVKYLLDNDYKIDNLGNDNSPLYYSVINENKEITRLLIDSGCNIDNSNPIYYACKNGFEEIVDMLLEKDDIILKTNVKIYENYSNNQYTALSISSKNGYLEIVKKIFNRMSKNSIKNGLKYIINDSIFYACQNGHLEIVKFLHENGAILEKDKLGYKETTLLYEACKNGHLNVVKYLYKNNCNIDKKTDDDMTPICVASEYGHLDIVKFLVECGVTIKIENEGYYEKTVIYYAVNNKYFHIIEYLKTILDEGVFLKLLNTGINNACYNNDKDTVEFLIKSGADINYVDKDFDKEITPLISACKININNQEAIDKTELISYLIQNGADVNKLNPIFRLINDFYEKNEMKFKIIQILINNGSKILIDSVNYSIYKCNLKIFRLLYNNLNKEQCHLPMKSLSYSLIKTACEKNKKDILEFLYNEGLRNDYATNLISITKSSNIVKLLIQNGHRILFSDLLHHCSNGNYDIVKLLLETGKLDNNCDTYERQNKSPIYNATNVYTKDSINNIENRINIIKLLTKHGYDINWKKIEYDNISNTPLLNAIYYEQIEMVREIIKLGADVNLYKKVLDEDDEDEDECYLNIYPLIESLKCKNEMVRLLIQSGAKYDQKIKFQFYIKEYLYNFHNEKVINNNLKFLRNYKKDNIKSLIKIGYKNESFILHENELYKNIYSFL